MRDYSGLFTFTTKFDRLKYIDKTTNNIDVKRIFNRILKILMTHLRHFLACMYFRYINVNPELFTKSPAAQCQIINQRKTQKIFTVSSIKV